MQPLLKGLGGASVHGVRNRSYGKTCGNSNLGSDVDDGDSDGNGPWPWFMVTVPLALLLKVFVSFVRLRLSIQLAVVTRRRCSGKRTRIGVAGVGAKAEVVLHHCCGYRCCHHD